MATPQKCIKCGRRVPLIAFAGNLGLSAVKVAGGILSHSVGLTVDGFHSLSDAMASLFVLASLRIAEKPKDPGHPYGHGKVEFMASLLVYTVLFGVGVVFLVESTLMLALGIYRTPRPFAAIIALISILANYVMLNLNHCAGGKLNSPALIANGHENLTDLLSSIPVLAGIIAAQFGLAFCDPLAGLLVSALILNNAGRMWIRSIHQLLDRGVRTATLKKIRAIAMTVEGVLGTEHIRTRLLGKNLWVDLGVLVGPDLSVDAASRIADEARSRLLRKGAHVEDVVVYFHANRPNHSRAAAAQPPALPMHGGPAPALTRTGDSP